MATEIQLGSMTLTVPEDADLNDPLDRVLHTAGDRPNTVTLPALVDPADDHIDEQFRARRADVEEKHRRVIEFLDRHGYDAVVLQRTDSVAWFTSGADLAQTIASEQAAVLIYINRQSRAIITDNVQSARTFEEELAGLGFQLKERPWHEGIGRVIDELGHNKKVASDGPYRACIDERELLRLVRHPFTKWERHHLRMLGRTLSLAVEATCRNFQPGETEADLAGHLAHRLLREGVTPLDLRVSADDRLARYREPRFKAAKIRTRATISAVGRRHGLCASVTRMVSFGKVERPVREALALTAMVDATCIFFSRPGQTVADVFRRARRIYEKFDHVDEWALAYQGFQIGYAPREVLLLPDSRQPIVSNMALNWCPSVGPTRSEDTIVVDDRGFEVVTEAQVWPKLEVMVKGFPISRPGILVR